MSVGAVVLAAGQGTRFGQKKQFTSLDGNYYFEHVRNKIHPLVDSVIVIGVDIPGGNNRAGSVYIGLETLKTDYVLLLEAARPLVTQSLMEKMIESRENALITTTPTTYTIYDTTQSKGLERRHLMDLHVPQFFSSELLRKGYRSIPEKQWENITSDSSLVPAEEIRFLEIQPKDSWQLYKATFPHDRLVIETLYNEYYKK